MTQARLLVLADWSEAVNMTRYKQAKQRHVNHKHARQTPAAQEHASAEHMQQHGYANVQNMPGMTEKLLDAT